jgi:pyruvate formate lyase activating enzyme
MGIIHPESLVRAARQSIIRGNIGLAYTYNEPLTSIEYVLETAALIRESAMRNVLVTNGFVNPEPLDSLLPYMDAMNIDLKAFGDPFYRNLCGGNLAPVKETIQRASASCHVEVTTLIIPGKNDDPGEVEELAAWLASIDKDIPLHLTRYHPAWHMTEPPQPERSLMERLGGIAGLHLSRVRLGNM